MGYRVAKKAWQYFQPFWYNTSVWRTDIRTDRRTDVQPISITCFSIADARKNHWFFPPLCLEHLIVLLSYGYNIEIYKIIEAIFLTLLFCPMRDFFTGQRGPWPKWPNCKYASAFFPLPSPSFTLPPLTPITTLPSFPVPSSPPFFPSFPSLSPPLSLEVGSPQSS